MLRTSVLERLSGPLCDAVMEQEGSAATLDALSRSNLFLVPLDDEGRWSRFHHLFAQLLRMELERREPGLAPALHRRAYCWHRDHGTTEEAIRHAMAAGAYAEAAELVQGSWISYANTYRYDTVLAWLRRLPDEVLSGDVQLLLVKAWVLSLSARREEAALAVAAVEREGDLGAGPLPDGFSSGEASLTLLRACFPWGDVGAQLENARRAAELRAPGRLGGHWRAGRSARACTSGVSLKRPTGGSRNRRRWRPRARSGWLARRRWPTDRGSPASGAVLRNSGCWPRRQPNSRESMAPGKSAAWLRWRSGITCGTRQARGGTAADRTRRRLLADLRPAPPASECAAQPGAGTSGPRRAHACRRCDSRDEIHPRILPGSGILAGRLAALGRPPQIRRDRSAEPELTQRELWVLKLLHGDLSERDIGRELYVTHSTVHSHVRAIYRKLAVSTRADALQRGRELGLL